MTDQTADNSHLAYTWMRGDGSGYFFDCPVCHFYKNNDPGECRRIGCDGVVVKVEIVTNPPARPTLHDRHMRGEWLSDDELEALASADEHRRVVDYWTKDAQDLDAAQAALDRVRALLTDEHGDERYEKWRADEIRAALDIGGQDE